MAVKSFSTDKKFFRLSGDPIGMWTCVTCACSVLVANRPAHNTWHAALNKKMGFGA